MNTQIFTPEGLKKRLLNFIIMKDLPFSTVEDDTLKNLLEYCNPSAVTSSARTLRREIELAYKDEKSKLQSVLKVSSTPRMGCVECLPPHICRFLIIRVFIKI